MHTLRKDKTMADEQPNKEEEVTPKGAVEVKEEDLDRAAGGISGYSAPTIDDVSMNYNKIDTNLVQKVAPTDLKSAGQISPDVKT
jgi:hypothetical protein